MPAYVLAGSTVVDAEKLQEYAKQVPATLEPFGGKYVSLGGQVDVVEGTWTTPGLVIIEFPDLDHARGWYQSDAYQSIIQKRFEAVQTEFFLIVEGLG